jgi:CubicO group peptidase (beta-lactamase class C family)
MSHLDLAAVDAAFAAEFDSGAVPGISFAVMRAGEIVHSGSFGTLDIARSAPPQIDSVFRIASMTKSFTAATLLCLRDQGLLRLDDAVAHHLPEVASGLTGPTADSPPLTIRDLLTMGGGFPTDDPWGDRQQSLPLTQFDALVGSGPARTSAPDLEFEYSNLSYALLGRLITALTSRDYDDVVREVVLEPLGMADSTFHPRTVPVDRLAVGYARVDGAFVAEPVVECGAFAPMGGLLSSVRDLARWVSHLSNAYPARDDADAAIVARRSTLREMQEPRRVIDASAHFPALGAPARLVLTTYGYGLVIEDDATQGRTVSHSGGYPGFGSHMRWHRASGLAVIGVANVTYAPVRRACGIALDALLADRPRARRAAWSLTADAEQAIERLLVEWDDALADRWFAANMDLDLPRGLRRREFVAAGEVLGALRRDPTVVVEHSSGAHSRWWCQGEHGRLRIDLLLSPEPQPRIQAVRLLVVPAPAPQIQAVVHSAAAAEVLSEVSSRWDRPMTPDDVGPVVAGDGITRSVFAMSDPRVTLDVRIGDDGTPTIAVLPAPQQADGNP